MGALLTIVFAGLRGALPLLGGFFTGGFSWVWGIFSAFVGTETGSKVVIGLACVLGGWIWGFSHEHARIQPAVELAMKAEDDKWGAAIAKANAAAEQRIQEALDAGRKVSETPSTPADIDKLCAAERPTCRGQAAKRRVVQTPKSNVGH